MWLLVGRSCETEHVPLPVVVGYCILQLRQGLAAVRAEVITARVTWRCCFSAQCC